MLDSALVMMGLAYFYRCALKRMHLSALPSPICFLPHPSLLSRLRADARLKNTVMMLHAFKPKFVICLSVLITVVVFVCIKVVSLL
ncbi:hypothetical protein PO124_03790 [Bacillus licheniformis]|nr:hypothetical protein [Bacillus licheniformis]